MSCTSVNYWDVAEAYRDMQIMKAHFTKWEDTRNGRALVFQDPVCVTFKCPGSRVLLDPKRNANPFLHFMEALWMLGGRNDVEWPAYFSKNMENYSDDGKTLHGAYGHRWRYHYSTDQLYEIVRILKKDPNSRRAVLAMWDAEYDLSDKKDLPCNTHIYFQLRDGALNMTVCNRSNDLVWGMLGSNYVTFSILQEYLAGWLGVNVGLYHHFTNNLHVYEGWEDKFSYDHPPGPTLDRYRLVPINPTTLPDSGLRTFLDRPLNEVGCGEVIETVAKPMYKAWILYKESRDFDKAVSRAEEIADSSWRTASVQWLARAAARNAEKG